MKDETLNSEWIDKQVAEFEGNCKRMGLKITPQRVEIYKELIGTAEHPSAEMLWRKVKEVFPNVSLDTVNRTLLTLNEIGSAFIVEGSGDVKRFDGGPKNHQHLRCVKCRKIIDFHDESFDNIEVPKAIAGDFEVLRKTIYIEGICGECKTRQNSEIRTRNSE